MSSLMTMNYIVPKGSCSGYGGVSGCEQKTLLSNKKTSFLRIQTGGGCEGLRSQNAVDSLHVRPSRSGAKLTPRLAKREAPNSKPGRPAIICGKGMSLVFVGAEMAPWSKTGALGDALGGLPAAMAANGHRVMAIAPRYDQYKDGWDTSVTIEITVGNRIETVRYFHCYKRGVDRVFIDHPWFLAKVWGKTEGKLYGPVTGVDYEDNQLRYSLFCKAALEAPRILNLKNSEQHSGPYGENVVFIANDWHAAPLPCYLKGLYQSHGIYKNAKVVFCIHNIVYQGRFAFSDLSLLNLPDNLRSSFDFTDGHDKPVKGRKINWMKAGIVESDRVVTVSPYYAQEIVSGEARGVELDNIIRMTGITGIVNGMDVAEWDPSTDKYITANYDASTVMHAKPLNKEALQAELGLAIARDVPIIAFLGRLEEQRGSDILAAAIPEFINENVQLIALGTGKNKMEVQLARLEEKYQEQIRVHFKFNVQLAHQIMAGADFLIIPSRFEPCGLTQFQGMRYGLPSICATTGGLVDTVEEGITGFHMGAFSVDCDVVDEEDVQKVVDNVKRALKVYRTPAFAVMIQNCMSQDFSWKGPAKKWEQVLLSLGVTGSEPGIEEEETSPLASENVASPRK